MSTFRSFHARFRTKLRRLRIEAGLRQEDLETTNLSLATIQRIERGERQPTLEAIFRLARRLDVDPSELLDLSAERPDRVARRRGGPREKGKPA